jgi:hypothetical protein
MFKHKQGWLEAFKAVGYGLGIIAVLGIVSTCVSGCTGTTVAARLTHHSSIPKFYDSNESNMVGPVVSVPVCGLDRDWNRYCPVVEFSAQWDLRDNRPYGTDPVGTINITQPIWVKR